MNKEPKKLEGDQVSALETISSQMESQPETRRRFIKKAIATAPVILTVTAGPAWATRLNCTASGQASFIPGGSLDPCGGEGCSPGFWAQRTDMWAVINPPPSPQSTTFKEIFDGSDAFGDSLLVAVLEGKKQNLTVEFPGGNCNLKNESKCLNAIIAFGSQAAAAWFNSMSPVSFELTPDAIVDLFNLRYGEGDYGQMEAEKDMLDEYNNRGTLVTGFCS